jgi:hypothetical protein
MDFPTSLHHLAWLSVITNLEFPSLLVIRSKTEALSAFIVQVKAASLSCCLLDLITNFMQMKSENSRTSTYVYLLFHRLL